MSDFGLPLVWDVRRGGGDDRGRSLGAERVRDAVMVACHLEGERDETNAGGPAIITPSGTYGRCYGWQ
jgi:hypothetical protein